MKEQFHEESLGEGAGHNAPEIGVGELSNLLKSVVEGAFSRVRVRGEISGFKRAASGHLYFALKDADAVLDGVCWRGTANRLGVQPEDGMEVIATGRLTTYPGRSKYQIVVEGLELAGEGALLKMLEMRKKALAAEGLFDPAMKQEIPFLPEVIGVVTSPTGAVIRDILHRLNDRFPRHVLLWPVVVQGEGAAEQITAAIEGFNNLPDDGPIPRPGLLIVARGGGSLEDLMAFNDEDVVRAAGTSVIPLISAVGHETDTTLIDYASDLRAPTPTAAAEMAVPVRLDLLAQVQDDGARLTNALSRLLGERKMRLDGLARGLPEPSRAVEEAGQRLDDWSERLGNALKVGVERRSARLAQARLTSPKQKIAFARERLSERLDGLPKAMMRGLDDRRRRLESAGRLLESFSYRKTLERGFALVRDADGQPLKSVKSLKTGDGLRVEFADGKVDAVVSGSKPKPKPRKTDDRQDSLF